MASKRKIYNSEHERTERQRSSRRRFTQKELDDAKQKAFTEGVTFTVKLALELISHVITKGKPL